MTTYDKRYLLSLLFAGIAGFLWHVGRQEIVLAGIVMMLAMIFEKVEAGH